MDKKQLDPLIARAAIGTSAELAELWTAHLRERCPRNALARRRGLAWRLQAQVYGGLSDRTERRLKELEAAFACDPKHQPMGTSTPRAGTQFVRHWKGRSHTVHVTPKGFLYAGTDYRSLSEVARQITGTRWSGPRFFGMKGKVVK